VPSASGVLSESPAQRVQPVPVCTVMQVCCRLLW
jgi:hypothetical protein